MSYTIELINVQKANSALTAILEEFETEKIDANFLLQDIYNQTGEIGDQLVSPEIVLQLRKKWDFFKQANGMIHERSKYLKYPGCQYIIAFRDQDHRLLISMLIFKKIGNSQYHIGISKSIKTTIHYIISNIPYPPDLSVNLHKEALKLTGATKIYAPPLPVMLDILKKNFQSKLMPIANSKVDYSNDFNADQITDIENNWPNFCNIRTYCFYL